LQSVIAQLTQIGNRLNRYLLFKKKSIDTLAREAGISSTLITNILNGGSYDFIFFLKVIHLLPDLNPCWVITGEGHMLTQAPEAGTSGIQTKTAALQTPAQLELTLPPTREEMAALRKLLAEKNTLIKRLKKTMAPVQALLMEID
jgi:transcriptional regulator with XRE-family HTH domain